MIMNKKVLTLCAGFLLAGTLANAQEKHWVKVEDPTLMLFNQAYVVSNLDGDSILSKKTSNYDQAYLIKKSVKDEAGEEDLFYLKGTATNFNIISGAESTGKQGLYTNNTLVGGPYYFNVENAKSTLALDKDGNIKITSSTNPGSNEGNPVKGLAYLFRKESANKGDITGVAEANDYTKYAFWMQTTSPQAAGDVFEGVEQTLFLMSGGSYVVVKDGAVATETVKPADGDLNAVWMVKDGGLYNPGSQKYLTYASNNWSLSDAAVSFSLNGPIAVVNGKAVKEASLVDANTALPSKLSAGWDAMQTAIDADGNPEESSFVLYARNSVAINWELDGDDYIYGAALYNAQDAKSFIFTLSKEQASDSSWKVYLMQDGKHVVVNNNWVELEVSANKDTYGLPTDAKVLLTAGSQYVAFDGLTLKAVNKNQATWFGLGQLQEAYISANTLIKRYGDYFTLDITYKNDKNKDVDLTGVFDGQLRPVRSVTYYNGSVDYVDAQAETDFMLVNEEGNIIVIDTEKPLHVGSSNIGYAFTTLTPKEWQEAVSTGKENRYLTLFRMSYTPGQEQDAVTGVTSISVTNNLTTLYIGRQKDGEDFVLVAAPEANLFDVEFELNAGNGIMAQEWLTSPSYYIVECINKDKNASHYGKVLGLDEDGYVAWVAPENVDLSKPEGQFAIDQNYKFTNRENHASATWILDGELYQVEKNVYAVVHSNWSEGNDTLRITPITADKYTSADGFKRFTAAELNANTYTVAMKLLNGASLNIIENHDDKHRIGLDEDNATEWRIEMPTVKLKDVTGDFTRMAADTAKIETVIEYYVDGGWHETQIDDPEAKYYYPNTELQICTYVLKNTDTQEYLNGKDNSESTGNAYYICEPKDAYNNRYATRIAFKLNEGETVNIVPVYQYVTTNSYYPSINIDREDYESNYESYAKQLKLSDYKIIGGTTSLNGVLKDADLYEATANDLFVINKASAPTYKKMEQGDKIILSLKNNTENVLVEGPKGELATISNREAHKNLNPTLYVDTAYVNRDGNYAYQYLLGVRINRVDTTYKCNEPSHGTHHADTTFGYFLVNMIDSAKACTDVHNNKFVYNDEYKLDFVEAYHTNDTLFFTNEAGEVTSKMEVGNGDFNIAKYAFKMIDEGENEFVIETAAGYSEKLNWAQDNNGHWHWTVASVESVPGYLRWVNGNLVVTSDINEAAHFTMEASDKEATANEAISAGNVVVAGTNGAVVVKGAEGKNVIVSTILGKVVANEVVSSDNAQITAPAGIVVVSVDGESFKVVVK